MTISVCVNEVVVGSVVIGIGSNTGSTVLAAAVVAGDRLSICTAGNSTDAVAVLASVNVVTP